MFTQSEKIRFIDVVKWSTDEFVRAEFDAFARNSVGQIDEVIFFEMCRVRELGIEVEHIRLIAKIFLYCCIIWGLLRFKRTSGKTQKGSKYVRHLES